MLRWALGFFMLAVVAALPGFGGAASATAELAKIFFYVFFVVFLITFVYGLMAGRRPLT